MICQPCKVRGKTTEATRTVAGEPWCDLCFFGEPPDSKAKREAVVSRNARYKQAFYARRREMGVCYYCRKKAVPGQQSCEFHLKKRREYWRERYVTQKKIEAEA